MPSNNGSTTLEEGQPGAATPVTPTSPSDVQQPLLTRLSVEDGIDATTADKTAAEGSTAGGGGGCPTPAAFAKVHLIGR